MQVVKNWNSVQMKLSSCSSRIEFGDISEILNFRMNANMAASNTGNPLKEKIQQNYFFAFKKQK